MHVCIQINENLLLPNNRGFKNATLDGTQLLKRFLSNQEKT